MQFWNIYAKPVFKNPKIIILGHIVSHFQVSGTVYFKPIKKIIRKNLVTFLTLSQNLENW